MGKRILYLTFYYEPDLCAGSFRNTPLVACLAARFGGEVDVQTSMPQRYGSYSQSAKPFEENGNVSIWRIPLPAHRSGMSDQVKSFYAYYRQVLKNTKGRQYDLVVASSSRLFTAYLGYKISKKKKIPLYLDIRDIFVDTMNDVLKNPLMKAVVSPLIKHVEKKAFGHASHINLISEGFKPYFQKYKNASYSYWPNGIDQEFTTIRTDAGSRKKPWVITYAGNMGEGQGLHRIIPQAAKKLGPDYRFRIVGDGGLRKELEDKLKRQKVSNVEIIDPIARKDVLAIYQDSDFLFLHLNAYSAFEKVLPSKIFEYGGTDKPIIAGVSGYAAEFIRENVPNSIVFPPTDADRLVELLGEYTLRFEERSRFIEKYSRESVNQGIVSTILPLLR